MALGRNAVQLLRAGEFEVLASRFGYALAFGRAPAVVIQEDLMISLGHIGSLGLASNDEFGCEVNFFAPNTSALLAVIECVVPAENEGQVLVELVVSSSGSNKYVTLEQISAAV